MNCSQDLRSFLVTHRSSAVLPGGTFVAIKGSKEDGAAYIVDALQRGARTIIVASDAVLSREIRDAIVDHTAELVAVPDVRRAFAELSAAAYEYPACCLQLIGITGTKGKTTTSWLLYHLLRESGLSVALLSTVMNRIGDREYVTELTTQQPDYMHAFFRECVTYGVTHVVVEVAAQAVTLRRVAGLEFTHIAWLNFSQEHGEFYKTEQDYFSAKADLLSHVVPGGTILVNGDDQRIVTAALTHKKHLLYYSVADVIGTLGAHNEPSVSCMYEHVQYTCGGLWGVYNGTNVLAAVMLARSLGVGAQSIAESIQRFPAVPGRMNLYRLPNESWGCIDYAHNPSSFEAVLQELRVRTQQLIVVFGCGGERDRAKRPVMGEIAARYGDEVIITTDNPRSEDLQHIMADIVAGISPEARLRTSIVFDRAEAISQAYRLSNKGAIIALLGKGPDEYQLIDGVKHYFSERSILQTL